MTHSYEPANKEFLLGTGQHTELPGTLELCWLRDYLPPFFPFFGAAFLDGSGFFAADFVPPRFPPKAFSQPSEYF